MINRNFILIALFVMTTMLLSLSGGIACANDKPLTPEYAAKIENHRKQQEQRITEQKRKAAAEALKAERLKVHNAKEYVKHARPEQNDNK